MSVTMICPWWVVTEFHEAQLDKNGVPRGERGRAIYSKKMMTAEHCAEITLRAACLRREVLMGLGRWTILLRTLNPGLADWLAVKVFLAAAARRVRSGKIEAEL